MSKLRILLSDHSARELSDQVNAICGPEGWTHVTDQDVHSGIATPDVAFISREVTGLSLIHI